jgi:hypothetical protein
LRSATSRACASPSLSRSLEDLLTILDRVSAAGAKFRSLTAERSIAGLLNALEACASIFKHAQCVNYFEASGYDAS